MYTLTQYLSSCGDVADLSMPAGDELLCCSVLAKPVLRGTVSGESAGERSDLEPFFGTRGAFSAISERASRDVAPEIYIEKASMLHRLA